MTLKLTNHGNEIVSNSMNNGTSYTIKYIGVGDGNGSTPEFTDNSIDLVNRRYYGVISEYTTVIQNGTSTISMSIVIPYTTGGYTIREVALYIEKNGTIDDDGAFALGTIYDIYNPSAGENINKVHITIKCVLQISSDANITISTSSESELLNQKISDIVSSKLNEYFSENPIHAIPENGNFGNILFKTGEASDDYVWLSPGMMISDMVRSDENDNKFIN